MVEKKLNIKAKQIELPKINVEQYFGKKVKIANVEYFESEKYGTPYAKVSTEELAVIDIPNKEPIVIKATKNLGLAKDENDNIGWGEGTKTDLFLKHHKVGDIESLVGKTVIVKGQEPDKNGNIFLTF